MTDRKRTVVFATAALRAFFSDAKACLAMAAILIVFMLAGGSFYYFTTRVCPGVSVEGIVLGGKSRREAARLLTNWSQTMRADPIRLYYHDKIFVLDPATVEFAVDVEGTLAAAWSYGHSGNFFHRLDVIYTGLTRGLPLEAQVVVNEDKLTKIILQWADAINRPARNASFSLETGELLPEQDGRKLDFDLTRQVILQALKGQEAGNVALVVHEEKPQFSVKDIQATGAKELLASYSTLFNPKDANRTFNIRLAAEKINGTIIPPGKLFSFNEVVGPRELRYGFKEALEIVDGEFVPGVGGGICQVSSTLYNAVLLANLKVIERLNHAKPLSYVPLGRDATVSYGVIDFKFMNSGPVPIIIIAQVYYDQLTVGIFGQRFTTEKIEIHTTDKKIIRPGTVKKEDPALPPGETVTQQGSPGYEIAVYRVWKLDGRETRRELLSRDRYAPTDTVIKFGAKRAPGQSPVVPEREREAAEQRHEAPGSAASGGEGSQ